MFRLSIKAPSTSLYAFIFFTIVPASAAFAACTPTNITFSIPDQQFNLNAIPLNGKIGSELISAATDIFKCTDTGGTSVTGRDIGNQTTTAISIDGRTIFSTSAPGIGYALAIEPTNFCSNTLQWVPFLTCKTTTKAFNFNAKVRIQFYKTGPIKSASSISINTKNFIIWENRSGVNDVITTMAINFNPFNLTVNTCSLLSGSITNINLPQIARSSLPNTNSIAGSTPFRLTITCPSNINLNITFTDNNNIGQTTNILTPATTSTAKGVGIQLQYNGKIISFGPDLAEPGTTNQIVLNSNLAGVQSFPFSASYIRTGTVTPGSLSSTATFTLSYQ
ncbi:fimbrial protein [Aquitalea sp. USM4]|uniref:fimbrial protein n=1 Tax=Aquitalea sp. USM4 TaxID=1590041 RepID=UPI0013F173FD|nr:fimbrial protein [Aquitalea sp. USM4]